MLDNTIKDEVSDNLPVEVTVVPVAQNNTSHSFGKYIKRSRVCPVCLRHDHMEINRMRACDYKTVGQIAAEKTISPKEINSHFQHHFLISKTNQDILNVREDTSQEANEIISRIFEGDMDLYGGATSVLESKAQRLKPILARISFLTDKQENEALEDIEQQELIMLNKLAQEIEDSVMKVYQIIDKKVFPTNKEDIGKAVLSYKHSVLRKFVDNIIIVLMEFEKNPEYEGLVQQLRMSLAQRISYLEASILKSGGVMKAIEDSNETA
jgi:hypothetical protein